MKSIDDNLNGSSTQTKAKREEKEQPRKHGIFTATAKPPPPLAGFQTFTEQVAGHLETHNVPCFMIDNDGHILKILDKGTKMVYREQEFYETIFDRNKDEEEWPELKKFIPAFFGTTTLLVNQRQFCYLKMQNLVHRFEHPCIMDMKIGKITYDPFATSDKIHRELIRYDYQSQLGFRISGFKVFKAKTGKVELYDRFHCKKFTPDDMEPTFRYFFDLENFPERILLMAKMLERLNSLMKWFNTQKRVKFYCTSLLLAYDGTKNIKEKIKSTNNTNMKIARDKQSRSDMDYRFYHTIHDQLTNEIGNITVNSNAKINLIENEPICSLDSITDEDVVVSMIDFTHTFIDFEGMTESTDENYMHGLQTVIAIFENMLKS